MALTNNRAQQQYLAARTALNNIARSLRSTQAQVNAARAARTKLTKAFIAQNIADVQKRTRLYKQFISDMKAVITKIERGPVIKALDRLKGVVDSASKVLSG